MKITWLNNWLKKRDLKKYDYQEECLLKISDHILNKKDKEPIVLAASPGAGKTVLSIIFIEWYLKQNPNSKILVLTHGTNVLKTQYFTDLIMMSPNFTFTLDKTEKCDVLVQIPQGIKNTKLGKFDLIVVDEAHQFYLAPQVQSIIKRSKPKNQLLLTGTPSPFIEKKYKIIPVAMEELLKIGQIQDIKIEIGTTTYDFKSKDYNSSQELRDDYVFKEKLTISTLDILLKEINLKIHKGNLSWNSTLSKLKKTMFVCRNQNQARQVKKYFNKLKLDSALSISDTDKDSLEIARFKADDNCLILIVVGRGIIGFNYPKLINLIDMSGSHNVDRLFQMLARVIRKYPNKVEEKIFFKITPDDLSEYTQYIMTAVMCLTNMEWYLKFNGKNFLDLPIPMVSKMPSENENPNAFRVKNEGEISFRPLDFLGIPAFDFFMNINSRKNDKVLSGYTYTTINNVKKSLGQISKVGLITKEYALEDAKQYTSKTEWSNKSKSIYEAARINDWLDECCAHMVKKLHYWTKDECIASALRFTSSKDWKTNDPKPYNAAVKNGWYNECKTHFIQSIVKTIKVLTNKKDDKKKTNIINNPIKKVHYWTKEECLTSALKYKRSTDWKENDINAYKASIKNGWFSECKKHFIIKKTSKWTKDKCLKVAKKYNTLKDFRTKEKKCYEACLGLKYYKEATSHMIKNSSNVHNERPVIIEKIKYKSITQAAKKLGLSQVKVFARLNSKTSRFKNYQYID